MSGLKLTRRSGIWYASGTIGGQRIRKSLGTGDKQAAEEIRAQYEAKLWKRHTYGEEAVRTFEEAALSYMSDGGEGRFLPAILRYFKGRAVASIKPGEVRDAALSIYPTGAASTRNRQAITPAQAVVNHAADRGWCQPMRVKRFAVSKSQKHKPVDRAWINAFTAEADRRGLPHLSALVLFMHQTGARRSEAVRLVWGHVDLKARVAVLERTKTEEFAVKHLTSELVVRFAQMAGDDSEPVFGYTDPTAVNKRMKVVCRSAGIEYRSTHSAGRHSFGTNAMRLGVGVKEAMEAGGWKSAKLFLETYVHADDAGRSVAAAIDAERGPIGANLAQVKNQRRKSQQ